jgi:hypothetical protein
MLPPELSASGPTSRGSRPGVVLDVPTVVPPRAQGLLLPGGQVYPALGGVGPSKALAGPKEGLSDSERVAVLLQTLQAKREQFALERQRMVEQHEAEVRSAKSKGKSPASQKRASTPVSRPAATTEPTSSAQASLSSPFRPKHLFSRRFHTYRAIPEHIPRGTS